MIALILWFLLFTIWVACFLWFCLPGKRGALALLVYTGVLCIVWVGGAEVLARPKPVHLEWRSLEQAEIIAARIHEDVAIYLWLDGPEPRAYVLPWDLEIAKKLVGAMREGGQERRVMLSLEKEPQFHVEPQEAPPPKIAPAAPEIFRRPL